MALMVVFVYLIVASGSRKAAAGVILIFSVLGIYYAVVLGRRSLMKALALVIIGVLGTVLTVAAVLQSEHGDRFVRLYDGYILGKSDRIETSEENRLLMYKLGWQTGMENPLLGIGLDNFRTLQWSEMGGSVGTYAHSNYIELFAGTGILGVLVYYTAWMMVFFRTMKRLIRVRVAAQISGVLLLIMFAYDFAAVSYYNKVAWVIYALILAGVYGFPESPAARIKK